MWPFRRKADPAPTERKAASFLLGPGASSYLARTQNYDQLALEGYVVNCAVNGCVNKVMTACSSVEPQLYKRSKGGQLTKVESHPLLALIGRPNVGQSWEEFVQTLAAHRLVSGNAYVLGTGVEPRGQKPPKELQLLPPGRVKVERGTRLGVPQAYEYSTDGGGKQTFPVDPISGDSAVLHLKTFNPLDPWTGLSPMLAAAYGIDIHNGGQQWNKRLIDNDARPSGALTMKAADGTPANLSDEQYERLRGMIDSMFSGASNAGRPLLLEGGLEWQQLSMTATDMDFTEGKNSAARDIALAFGVPPMLLGIPGDNTYSNMGEAKLALWTDTVLPLLGLILGGLNRWLTPRYGDDLFLWYDEEMVPALEPLREAKSKRINQSEFMTINEKRNAMGLDDIDGGDTLLVASSDIPLGLAGDLGAAEVGSPADPNADPNAAQP